MGETKSPPKTTLSTRLGLGSVLALLLVLAFRLLFGSSTATDARAAKLPELQDRGGVTTRPVAAPSTQASRPASVASAPRVAKPAGMKAVPLAKLPREAQNTVRLIKRGGPYPFAKDGTEFQNREGRLPRKARGYYKEYTVITPNSDDRGARRVVAGANGELYYTDDHYDSFQWVEVP